MDSQRKGGCQEFKKNLSNSRATVTVQHLLLEINLLLMHTRDQFQMHVGKCTNMNYLIVNC